jgi:hypothetical protein
MLSVSLYDELSVAAFVLPFVLTGATEASTPKSESSKAGMVMALRKLRYQNRMDVRRAAKGSWKMITLQRLRSWRGWE